jgi:hypothetical protein
MKHYCLSVRRYFDKVNGNSYHTIRIMAEGVDITLPMDYGHGNLTYLGRAGKALGVAIDLMTWEERREGFTIDETVVTRQKDLHKTEKGA